MGEVYLARDSELDRPVAIKLLPSVHTNDQDRLRRFILEAKAASALNHPNIVTIYEIGEEDAGRFIAMEWISGQTLAAVSSSQLSLERILRLCRQVAQALSVAHSAGIVHRDLKPQNIMVRDDGYVKVLDFGLARLVPGGAIWSEANTRIIGSGSADVTTAEGVIMGTFRYMSPEQAQGERVFGATDIFSFGIILYELTTGRHPFAADSRLVSVNAIISQPVVPPRLLNPEIPLALEALILRMLEKEPVRRPTAAEVVLALGDPAEVSIHALSPTIVPIKGYSVGRESEREELRKAFQSAVQEYGSMLCIAGEPGIGKTTLVEEFLTEMSNSPASYMVGRGRCSERLAGSEAYLPFLEALESLLNARDGGSVARLMKLTAPTWYFHLVPYSDEGSAERLQNEMRTASQEWMKRELGTFLQEVCKLRPLILFLDDLHWSDASTVELLAYVATKLKSMRMLILTTYRSSELLLSKHPFLPIKLDLQARGISRELSLEFLSPREVEEYLKLEFPEHSFPPEFSVLIHTKTEGSPLFMTDLVRYLRDRKLISKEENTWIVAQSLPDLEQELPESVRSMIQRKIEQLSDEDRRLLEVASVQGYEFDSAVLANVLNLDPDEIEQRLDLLERVHAFVRLVDEREFPDLSMTLRYRFVHVLYQNALYASLRPTRRATLSAAIAKDLLRIYQGQSSDIASELAFLFKAARDYNNAAEHFVVAAMNASRVYANQEAIVFYKNAAQMMDQLSRSKTGEAKKVAAFTAETFERLGNILLITGQHDEAREAFQKALAKVSADEKVICARLHRSIGKAWQTQRQSEVALKVLTTAEEALGSESSDSDTEWWQEWLQIKLERMWVFYWQARVEELNELAVKIRPIVERFGSETQRGMFYHALMLYSLRRDRYVTSEEALGYAEAALEAIRGADSSEEVTAIQFGNAFCHFWLGDFDRAEERLKETLHIANRRGDSLNRVLCLTYLVVIYRKRGQLEETLKYIPEALEAATAARLSPYIGMAKANLGWVAWRKNDYAETIKHCREAVELWQQGGTYPLQWAGLLPLMGATLIKNNISEAVECARLLLAPAQQKMPDELSEVVEDAIKAWESDDIESSRMLLTKGIELATELSYL